MLLRVSRTACSPTSSRTAIATTFVLGALLLIQGCGQQADPESPEEGEGAPAAASDSPAAGESASATGSSGINLAYVPDDYESLVIVRFSRLWNSPLVQNLMAQAGPDGETQIQKFTEHSGLAPDDIDTMIFAIQDLQGSVAVLADEMPIPLGPMPSPDDEAGASQVLSVIRTSKPVDPQKILSSVPSHEERTHAGKTYYEISQNGEDPQYMWFPESNVGLVGAESDVQAAIDRGSQPASVNSTVLSHSQGDHVVVYVKPDPQMLEEARAEDVELEPEDGDPLKRAAQQTMKAVVTSAQEFLIRIEATDGLTLRLDALSHDSSGASSMTSAASELVSAAKDAYEPVKDMIPPVLLGVTDGIVASLSASESGAISTLAATVPSSFFEPETLQEIPGLMFGLMMGGGGPEMDFGAPPEMPKPAAEVVEGGITKAVRFSTEEAPFGVYAPEDQDVLFVTLQLTGEIIPSATQYGYLEVSAAQDDTGAALELVSEEFAFEDATKQFVQLDRGMMFPDLFEGPEDSIEIYFMLTAPTEGAEGLAELSGTLLLMAGGERKSVTAPAHVLGPVENSVFSDAGITVTLTRDEDGFGDDPEQSVSVEVKGNTAAITEVDLVDADGEPLLAGGGYSGFGDEITYFLSHSEKITDAVQLKIDMAVNQKPVEIPFAFSDVKLQAPSE